MILPCASRPASGSSARRRYGTLHLLGGHPLKSEGDEACSVIYHMVRCMAEEVRMLTILGLSDSPVSACQAGVAA